jgi:SAM-dependent methyltransferase
VVANLDGLAVDELVRGFAQSSMALDVSPQFAASPRHVAFQQCGACSLKWYADAPAGDAAFYVALQRNDWYYQADKAEYAFARGHVAADARVLEVGCGRAAFRRHLGPGVTYKGLEFNEAAVAAARSDGLDVEIRSIADEARQRPAHHDVVCHFQVLEHVSDPAGFMRDCEAALRPGGVLIVAVPAEDSFVGLAESSWLNMPPHHLTRWPDRALQQCLLALGLQPVDTWHEPVAPLHHAWHRAVAVRAGWLSLAGGQPRLVARRTSMRLQHLAMRVPGLEPWLYARGVARFPQLSLGHTVCMVGRKP